MENKPLRNALLLVSLIAIVAATEMFAGFNEWLEFVPMPGQVRRNLLMGMVVDFSGSCFVEWLCYKLLFSSDAKI